MEFNSNTLTCFASFINYQLDKHTSLSMKISDKIGWSDILTSKNYLINLPK